MKDGHDSNTASLSLCHSPGGGAWEGEMIRAMSNAAHCKNERKCKCLISDTEGQAVYDRCLFPSDAARVKFRGRRPSCYGNLAADKTRSTHQIETCGRERRTQCQLCHVDQEDEHCI